MLHMIATIIVFTRGDALHPFDTCLFRFIALLTLKQIASL